MSNGSIALSEIEAARRYSLSLLEGVDEKDWFRMPAEGGSPVLVSSGKGRTTCSYFFPGGERMGVRPHRQPAW